MYAQNKSKIVAVYISDLHLCTKYAKAKQLLTFLKSIEFEELYLLGDIFDGYRMQKKICWDQDQNLLLRFFVEKTKVLKKIIYIPGNHDEEMRKFAGKKFRNVLCVKSYVVRRYGKKYLLIHGDEIEANIKPSYYKIGAIIYDYILYMDHKLNRIHPSIRLAKFIKRTFKALLSYVNKFEKTAISLADRMHCDKIICGHIHTPKVSARYINCGDWVENCSAIIERENGALELYLFK